jgi:hypothetical protein
VHFHTRSRSDGYRPLPAFAKERTMTGAGPLEVLHLQDGAVLIDDNLIDR